MIEGLCVLQKCCNTYSRWIHTSIYVWGVFDRAGTLGASCIARVVITAYPDYVIDGILVVRVVSSDVKTGLMVITLCNRCNEGMRCTFGGNWRCSKLRGCCNYRKDYYTSCIGLLYNGGNAS